MELRKLTPLTCLAAAIALFSLASNFVVFNKFSLEGEDSSLHGSTEAEAKPQSKDTDSIVINLNHGDPKMYEKFWKEMGGRGTAIFPSWQTMSYFSMAGSLCWFMEPRFMHEIVRIHRVVGNAVTEDRQIIVGTGSSQLFQAALYALSSAEALEPLSVVSAAPFYSSYPTLTSYLQSGLYQWAGDARSFNGDGPCIEVICSPNNPDGFLMEPILTKNNGKRIHDLAYYWPQYAPIAAAASHDLMLFTLSKATGHAGSRIGWALVKDKTVAEKMTQFIELNTIGVSKDSQLRAAQILATISDGCEQKSKKNLFGSSRLMMAERWSRLREAIKNGSHFTVPDYDTGDCKFTGESSPVFPAFAWLRCEDKGKDDCEEYLRSMGILTRGGKHFGWGADYARVSMLDGEENFNIFIQRILSVR